MRTPTEDENDKYNGLLTSIEDADSESPRWPEVRAALKMLWSLHGGTITETDKERDERINKEIREAAVAKTDLVIGEFRKLLAPTMKAGKRWDLRAITITHCATGLDIAMWDPSTGELCIGTKTGPRCYDAEAAAGWLKSNTPL